MNRAPVDVPVISLASPLAEEAERSSPVHDARFDRHWSKSPYANRFAAWYDVAMTLPVSDHAIGQYVDVGVHEPLPGITLLASGTSSG